MRNFLTALSFLTIIPVKESFKLKEYWKTNGYFALFPIVGLLIGGFLVCISYLMQDYMVPMLSAFFLILIYYILTGALHLDGVADCADAFYGNKEKGKVLSIMKDPTLGTMGSFSIIMILLLKFILFLNINSKLLFISLPIILMTSRIMPLLFVLFSSYVRKEKGIISSAINNKKILLIISLIIFSVLSFLFFPIVSLVVFISVLLFIKYCKVKIGGYTGDCIGASIELAEIMAFLTLFLVYKNSDGFGLLAKILN